MSTDRAEIRGRLDTNWERRVKRAAAGSAVAALFFSIVLAFAARSLGLPLWISLSTSLVVAGAVYAGLTRKLRRRRRILSRPFPAEWEAVLQLEVGEMSAQVDPLDGPSDLPARPELDALLDSVIATFAERYLSGSAFPIPAFYGFSIESRYTRITDTYINFAAGLEYTSRP